MTSVTALGIPGTFPKTLSTSEHSFESFTSSSPVEYDTDTFHEKNLLLKEELEKGNLPIKSLPRKKTMKYYFRKLFPIVMTLAFGACLLGIKMMPAKYMGTSTDRSTVHCGPGETCSRISPNALLSSALYDPKDLDEYPTRMNIHDRHNPSLIPNRNMESFTNSFLHPMLPENFISSAPPPENVISEIGLQFPWQTPSRWTYPAGSTAQDQNLRIPHDPNESTGGIPDIADEECLKRTNIPWDKKKGTKVYLKATPYGDFPGEHVIIKHIHEVSPPMGPGEPVKMDGEISVIRAEPGSREMKRSEIGVEFEIKLSNQEVFESVWMRKVGNGTVVLETNGGAYQQTSTCFEAHIIITIPPDIIIPSLTIHSLIFPINIHRGVSFRANRLDLFTNKGLVQSFSKEFTVFDSIVLGVGGGSIYGHFPLANKLNADCAAGSMHITTNILPNSETSPPLNPDPEITMSIGTGTAKIKIEGPIPRNRAEIRSSHVGAVGSQTVLYPSDWEGVVSCQVQVGSCHMWGKGLEIVETRNNNTGLNVYMKAVKGDKKFDGADTSIELRGGPVEVGIGDDSESELEEQLGVMKVKISLFWNGFSSALLIFVWIVVALGACGYLFD